MQDLCNQNGCAPLLGDNTTTRLYLKDGSNATAISIWYNGLKLAGGCTTQAACANEMVLPLPGAHARPTGGHSVLVVRMEGVGIAGKLRRLFVLR